MKPKVIAKYERHTKSAEAQYLYGVSEERQEELEEKIRVEKRKTSQKVRKKLLANKITEVFNNE